MRGLIVGEPVPARSGGIFELYYLFPLTAEQQTIALVQRTVLLAGIGLVVLVLGIALLVTRQVVRPVRVAAETAGRLAAGDLSKRIVAKGSDDIARLGQSFNDMADSLQRQIRRLEDLSRLQRRFTSDVSHELRTPLTTIRMASELLHGRPHRLPAGARPGRRAAPATSSTGSSRCSPTCSRSPATTPVPRTWSRKPRISAASSRRPWRPPGCWRERQGSEVGVEQPDVPVTVDMDTRRVERILRNLVGNALDHGEGKPVVITIGCDADAVAVTVRDHGIGLRPGEAGLVFNRFWRGDVSRSRLTGGTGPGPRHRAGGRPAARRVAAGLGTSPGRVRSSG